MHKRYEVHIYILSSKMQSPSGGTIQHTIPLCYCTDMHVHSQLCMYILFGTYNYYAGYTCYSFLALRTSSYMPRWYVHVHSMQKVICVVREIELECTCREDRLNYHDACSREPHSIMNSVYSVKEELLCVVVVLLL